MCLAVLQIHLNWNPTAGANVAVGFLVAWATQWIWNPQTHSQPHNLTNKLTYNMVQYGSLWTLVVPYMDPYCPFWSCMVPYGLLWSHIAPYGPLCSHMDPYALVCCCKVPSGPIWSGMVLYCLVWVLMVPFFLYGPICFHIWSCMVPYCPVWSNMIPYGPLWSYGPVCSTMVW